MSRITRIVGASTLLVAILSSALAIYGQGPHGLIWLIPLSSISSVQLYAICLPGIVLLLLARLMRKDEELHAATAAWIRMPQQWHDRENAARTKYAAFGAVVTTFACCGILFVCLNVDPGSIRSIHIAGLGVNGALGLALSAWATKRPKWTDPLWARSLHLRYFLRIVGVFVFVAAIGMAITANTVPALFQRSADEAAFEEARQRNLQNKKLPDQLLETFKARLWITAAFGAAMAVGSFIPRRSCSSSTTPQPLAESRWRAAP